MSLPTSHAGADGYEVNIPQVFNTENNQWGSFGISSARLRQD